MATISQVLRHKNSHEPALIGLESGSSTFTHGQLNSQINEGQDRLTQCGVAPGTTITISLPNSAELALLFLSICTHRAIAAPLNPAYKQDEVEFYAADVGAVAIVVPKEAFEKDSAAVRAAKELVIATIECYWSGKAVSLDLIYRSELCHQGGEAREEPCDDDVALVLHIVIWGYRSGCCIYQSFTHCCRHLAHGRRIRLGEKVSRKTCNLANAESYVQKHMPPREGRSGGRVIPCQLRTPCCAPFGS